MNITKTYLNSLVLLCVLGASRMAYEATCVLRAHLDRHDRARDDHDAGWPGRRRSLGGARGARRRAGGVGGAEAGSRGGGHGRGEGGAVVWRPGQGRGVERGEPPRWGGSTVDS